MGSIYKGSLISLSLFGESHGDAIGIVIDGMPHGIEIDNDFIASEMERRRSKNMNLSTARQEKDAPKILSGVLNNKLTGMPLAVIIENENKRSNDYNNLIDTPRPSHSDYVASIRYGNCNDISGGGHFSGRLTAPIVFAGALAKIVLKSKFNIDVVGHIKQVYDIKDNYPNDTLPNYTEFVKNYEKPLSVFDDKSLSLMINKIEEAKKNNDSVGGIIRLIAFNMPKGLGDPFFSSIESKVASALFSIPAVKGVDFGLGFDFTNHYGSECNDCLALENDNIITKTNHNGGINGGISNGMPIIVNVVIKPTPSIAKAQNTLNIKSKKEEILEIKGRHDPSIVVRALPVLEAMLAVTILDICMEMKGRIL